MANQRLMVAELARLAARLGDGDEATAAADVEAAYAAMPAPPAIDRLADVFNLSLFERDVVLLTAGAELDTRLAQLCGAASGRPGSATVTFGLALAALPDPVWSALAPGKTYDIGLHVGLERVNLMQLEPGKPGPAVRAAASISRGTSRSELIANPAGAPA